ncbi:MAG: DUF6439 family protein [Synechococcaceae cyanobacterium]|nr:DUF6439 family protein [Synechococcaceae cyanobacterium]
MTSSRARTLEAHAWPDSALTLAEALQQTLSIPERDWHVLKSQRPRRAAVQMAAALVQLLARERPDGQPADAQTAIARQECVALLENALGWLRGEIRDPGCPVHRR